MANNTCAQPPELYQGDGSTTKYSFSFPYLKPADIAVFLWNDTTEEFDKCTLVDANACTGSPTEYYFENSTPVEITFCVAPGLPPADRGDDFSNVIVGRETDICQMVAYFYPGTSIRAQDLNNDFTQILLAIQDVQSSVYKGLEDYKGFVRITGDVMEGGPLDMNSFQLTGVADPVDGTDAVPLDWADRQYVNVSGDKMQGPLDMADNRLTGVPYPSLDADAANKYYVDSKTGGDSEITKAAYVYYTANQGDTVLESGVGGVPVFAISIGIVQVFINGALQQKEIDYIVNSTTKITIFQPLLQDDVVGIYCINNIPIATAGQAVDVNYTYPGGVQQTVQARLEQYVSVKDFGAVGDGVIDDTAAIQAAFDWWAGESRRSLVFPKGEFICTSTIQAVQNMSQVLIGNSLVGQGGRLKFNFATVGVTTSRFGLVLNLEPQGKLMRELHISGLSITGNFDEYAMILDGGYSTSDAYLYGFVIERLYTSSRGLCVSGNAFEGVVRECYIAGEQGDGTNPSVTYVPVVPSVLITQAVVIGVEATDISFATNRTITTGGSINFAAKYKVDDEIIIRGSAQNDGTYTVEFVDSTTIRTYETTITTETAGNDILLLGGSGGGSRKISSLTLDSNNIRGGKYGILVTDGSGDVTLRNNTTLTSWTYGLFYNSTFSGCNILHHHAENCWQQYSESKWNDPNGNGFFDQDGKRWSGASGDGSGNGDIDNPFKGNWDEWYASASSSDRNSVLQRSGVRVVESGGAGNILACRQVNDSNGGTMSAISIFSTTTQPTLVSGTNASGMGTEVCVSGSGSVFLNTDSYKIVANWPKIIQTTGATTRPMLQSVLHGTGLNSNSQYTPFAQSSQSSILGSVFVPLKQGLTVNAPSSDYIPSYGDEFHFTFQQNQSTSAVVTFDPIYVTNGFVAKTGTKQLSSISFRYIKDNDGNDKWMITSSSPST